MICDKTKENKRKAEQYIHWCKENKSNRRIWMGMHRAKVRAALVQADYDNVPPYKASGGTLTW